MSAMFDACSRSDWTKAEALFDADPVAASQFRDRQDWSILHEAAHRNAPLSFVRKLLSHGLNPNQKNFTQRTPLHYAMQQQTSLELVELLLNVGANPNIPDNLGKTPMHWAIVESVPISMIQLAVHAGGDLNQRDNKGKTCIHAAVEQKVPPSYMRDLIKLGGDLKRVDNDGAVPLYTAVFEEAPPSLVKVLLEHGADMESKRFSVARYHGIPMLCQQIDKARIMITLCLPGMVKRLGRHSLLRVLPSEHLRLIAEMLYSGVSDKMFDEFLRQRQADEFDDDGGGVGAF